MTPDWTFQGSTKLVIPADVLLCKHRVAHRQIVRSGAAISIPLGHREKLFGPLNSAATVVHVSPGLVDEEARRLMSPSARNRNRNSGRAGSFSNQKRSRREGPVSEPLGQTDKPRSQVLAGNGAEAAVVVPPRGVEPRFSD